MLKHHRHARQRLLDPLAVDMDLASVELVQAADAAQQRGLAAAGRSDDADDLGTADGQTEVGEHVERAIAQARILDDQPGVCAVILREPFIAPCCASRRERPSSAARLRVLLPDSRRIDVAQNGRVVPIL